MSEAPFDWSRRLAACDSSSGGPGNKRLNTRRRGVTQTIRKYNIYNFDWHFKRIVPKDGEETRQTSPADM
jgi:hypothetical protein